MDAPALAQIASGRAGLVPPPQQRQLPVARLRRLTAASSTSGCGAAGVFKKLRRFRAGIEGCISSLERSFGMDRCRWRGLTSFKSYVRASVATCNLLILARHALQ